MTAAAAQAAARAAGVDVGTDENSFGDLLSELLRTLPRDAAALFLRSLSGLSPSESHDFCDHVSKLKPEKQFRVIQAMSEATVEGKRRFLHALAKKIKEQQAKQQKIQVQESKDMEEFIKRKEALSAKERVAAMNPAATKFHSFNAALGAGVTVSKESSAGGATPPAAAVASPTHKSAPGEEESGGASVVARSLSSSSLVVNKEDMKQVGRLLSNSHITESEHNLRELEINKKAFVSLKSSSSEGESVEMADAAKRDRPDSIRELVKHDEKPLQRTRSDGTEYSNQGSQENGGDEDDEDNDSPDGEGEGDSQNAGDPDAPSTKRWTKMQDNALRESVRIHGEKNWKAIAELVPGRNHAQCLQRWRKVLKPGLVKGHWSFEEDQILEYLVTQGCNNWGQIAERIPGRTPKQCRERWKNHLDPAINKGPYTEEEDQVILEAQARLGNKWSQIAQLLKGRTEDSVKIRWKSLKQNPAKAAATHAQIKKAQQQQQQQQMQQSQLLHHHHHHQSQNQAAAALAYQQNPALLRQRQLQLMQHQVQLQHSESAQLEHQHHLQQQQQVQMRLQERLLQQQRQAMMMAGSNQSSNDPLSLMKPDPSLTAPSPVSGLGISMANSHLYSPGPGYPAATQATSFTQQLTGSDGGFDFNIQATSTAFVPAYQGGDHHHQPHHHSDDNNDPWEMHGGLGGDELTRLGENPPPASFWENYPKHGGLLPEPIPISNQVGHMDPASHPGQFDEGVYDDAMFEKLASEIGNNGLHFATSL